MTEAMIERGRIADVIYTLIVATDKRDWTAVRACFTAEVDFDMTSLVGGTPQRLTPEAVASAWDTGLRPIEAVHHQAGNLMVEVGADEAAASCYGIAYHYRKTRSGKNTRLFVGSYDFHLRLLEGKWRIDLFRFNVKFVDGNLELEKEA